MLKTASLNIRMNYLSLTNIGGLMWQVIPEISGQFIFKNKTKDREVKQFISN